jgi:hypothetical protein
MSFPPGLIPQQSNPGLDAMLVQLAPYFKPLLDRIGPIINQPIIRYPYTFPLSTSTVIAAGTNNQPLLQSDFQNSLEYPFEVRRVIFSQDPSHTTRDWRFANMDMTFTMQWQKAAAMVATIVDARTLSWELEFPWVVRPKGGGLAPFVTNLDQVNPITVDIAFGGFLLLPRATAQLLGG